MRAMERGAGRKGLVKKTLSLAKLMIRFQPIMLIVTIMKMAAITEMPVLMSHLHTERWAEH